MRPSGWGESTCVSKTLPPRVMLNPRRPAPRARAGVAVVFRVEVEIKPVRIHHEQVNGFVGVDTRDDGRARLALVLAVRAAVALVKYRSPNAWFLFHLSFSFRGYFATAQIITPAATPTTNETAPINTPSSVVNPPSPMTTDAALACSASRDSHCSCSTSRARSIPR